MDDPFELQRFIDAQDPVYAAVQSELAAGHKTTHWMWFVFPQLRSLGRSEMAQRYGIASRDEALAYWKHPVLGKRLLACTSLVLGVRGRSAQAVFGSPDDLKFQSSMTLFGAADRQLEAVSFGKERPAVQGSNEEAWAKNRRAELRDK